MLIFDPEPSPGLQITCPTARLPSPLQHLVVLSNQHRQDRALDFFPAKSVSPSVFPTSYMTLPSTLRLKQKSSLLCFPLLSPGIQRQACQPRFQKTPTRPLLSKCHTSGELTLSPLPSQPRSPQSSPIVFQQLLLLSKKTPHSSPSPRRSR